MAIIDRFQYKFSEDKMTDTITHIIKRNGEKKEFDSHRIYRAVEKAFQSENINDPEKVVSIVNLATSSIQALFRHKMQDVTVEEVQDIVEKELMIQGFHGIAKNYILYREQQSRIRQEETFIKVQEKTLKVKVSNTEVFP